MHHLARFGTFGRSAVIGALGAALLYFNPAHAASFDCKAAKSAVEKMICSDGNLSKLDEELTKVYAQALVVASDREALKREQRSWVKNLRNKCNDLKCLNLSYLARTLKLKRFSSSIFVNGDSSNYGKLTGKWEPFSKAFHDTGSIEIGASTLLHESCETSFQLKYIEKLSLFEAVDKNTCYAFADNEPINYIKITMEDDYISVRYYSSTYEGSLSGIGAYSRAE